jgi:hypothetical protein
VLCLAHPQAKFENLKWSYEQTYFPFLAGEGVASAAVVNAEIHIGVWNECCLKVE